RIVPLFDTMLEHQGEGSGTPTEPHHTPTPEDDTSHPTTSSIPLPSIPTSSTLPTIADEPASPVRDVSEGEACPTESGFITDQDRATIAKSSTFPHDSAPRVTSPVADEEEEIVKLKERVKFLEDKEDVAVTQSGDDAPIKGRSINEGEAAAKRINAAIVLAGGIDVPTGSGFIPTAGPPTTVISTGSKVSPTAGPPATVISTGSKVSPTAGPPATVISTGSKVGPTASLISIRKKGKEVMVESDTPKKKKLQEQIDAQANDQEAKEGILFCCDQKQLGVEVKDFKEKEQVKKQKLSEEAHEIETSTEEFTEDKMKEMMQLVPVEDVLKRKGLNLEKEQVKKQKLSKEAPEIETSTEEFTEEKMKEMMQLVPVEDVYVQALQVKHPIIDWNVHTEGQRSYWQIIRLGGSYAYLLKQLDREDLNQLWDLVKDYLSIRPAISEKEMELWVELKRMYEPDPEDQLWTLKQNFMHASVEWKLYNLSEVHHLTAKDREIFMLVEKDYPLRKGLALVMISYKLQVKNYSQMAEDLIRKIYNIANTLR
nr:hypothetical protein [Tanacetum cinerariifolium]